MLKGKGIISPLQKALLNDLREVSDTDFFYLTGGTALSEFFFGHRYSYDLDLFTTERGLIVPYSKLVEQNLRQAGYHLKVIRRFESFAEFEVEKEGEAVILHLSCDSPFRFEPPVDADIGIKVNGYKDIITDKVLAYFGRWKHRDAVDLFVILKKEPVDTLLKMAAQKDTGFDLYWFSIALKEVNMFPDEIDRWPVDMLVELDVKELKDSFNNLAQELMERINSGRY